MLTFPYEQSETPPAPYIDLQVGRHGQPQTLTPARAKLDSGAALTVFPESLIAAWGTIPHGQIRVSAFDGAVSTRPLHYVDIIIGSRTFTRVEVTTSRRTNVLLGRDVLNQLSITHDGPRQQVRIHYIRPRAVPPLSAARIRRAIGRETVCLSRLRLLYSTAPC